MSEHVEHCRALADRLTESMLHVSADALRALLDERERLERERNTLVSMAIADCVRFDDPGPPGRGVHYMYNRQRYSNANDVRAAILADVAKEY
jgi:hypothetical protein